MLQYDDYANQPPHFQNLSTLSVLTSAPYELGIPVDIYFGKITSLYVRFSHPSLKLKLAAVLQITSSLHGNLFIMQQTFSIATNLCSNFYSFQIKNERYSNLGFTLCLLVQLLSHLFVWGTPILTILLRPNRLPQGVHVG